MGIDVLILGMDCQRQRAATSEPVDAVPARHVSEVVAKVVEERREEPAGWFRGLLADGGRLLDVRRVLECRALRADRVARWRSALAEHVARQCAPGHDGGHDDPAVSAHLHPPGGRPDPTHLLCHPASGRLLAQPTACVDLCAPILLCSSHAYWRPPKFCREKGTMV